VHIQTTTLQTDKPIVLSFTDKPITAWGGLSLLTGYAARIRLPERLRQSLPFATTSPNATPPADILLAFMAGVLTGARRLSHTAVLRHDEVIRQLFGLRRFASDITMARFFKKFHRRHIEEVFSPLRAWVLGIMTPAGSYTLDLDSSIFERYGKQEGAVLGYNPKKHRRPSHHPLFASLAENEAVVNAWLRSGNTASVTGATEFLAEALAAMPACASVGVVRGDSGFDSGKFFDFLEERRINYAVCGRFTRGVKREIAGVRQWRTLDADTEVAEVFFQAKAWSRGRRLVLIRQRNREKDFIRGRELFDDKAWKYQGIFTDLPWAPEEVWRFYRKRATLETKIRELKWDYGIDGFCMKKFFATEAAFQAVCLTYNLMQQFQKELGFRTKRTLGVVRMMVLSCGAELGRAGRKLVLRLSVSGGRRKLFEEYSQRIFHWEGGNCASVSSG
jgi:hypothetical protein